MKFDDPIKQQLYQSNQGLIDSLARCYFRRVRTRNQDFGDYLTAAYFVYISAVETYDPAKVPFEVHLFLIARVRMPKELAKSSATAELPSLTHDPHCQAPSHTLDVNEEIEFLLSRFTGEQRWIAARILKKGEHSPTESEELPIERSRKARLTKLVRKKLQQILIARGVYP